MNWALADLRGLDRRFICLCAFGLRLGWRLAPNPKGACCTDASNPCYGAYDIITAALFLLFLSTCKTGNAERSHHHRLNRDQHATQNQSSCSPSCKFQSAMPLRGIKFCPCDLEAVHKQRERERERCAYLHIYIYIHTHIHIEISDILIYKN